MELPKSMNHFIHRYWQSNLFTDIGKSITDIGKTFSDIKKRVVIRRYRKIDGIHIGKSFTDINNLIHRCLLLFSDIGNYLPILGKAA